MGNAQSAPTVSHHRRRPSNRLSKPLTNYSSPKAPGGYNRWNSTSILDEKAPSSHNGWSEQATGHSQLPSRNTLAEFPALVVDANDGLSKGPKVVEEGEEDSQSRFKTSVNGFKRRFSRSRTKSNAKRLPLEPRISPVQATNLADNNSSSPVSDPRNSERVVGLRLYRSDDINPLENGRMLSIRRRSLNTPGIATRYPRDSPPYYYNSSIRNSPPQMHCCQCGGNDVEPMFAPQIDVTEDIEAEDAIQRPVSPNELGYSHLGRLKFGSLRVVNGAVSPTPSSKRQTSCPDFGTRRDNPILGHEPEIYSQNNPSNYLLDDSQYESKPQRTFYNDHTYSDDHQQQDSGEIFNPDALSKLLVDIQIHLNNFHEIREQQMTEFSIDPCRA